MEFKSKAQIRKFIEMEASGELKQGTTSDWLKNTDIKKIPERATKPEFKKTAAFYTNIMMDSFQKVAESIPKVRMPSEEEKQKEASSILVQDMVNVRLENIKRNRSGMNKTASDKIYGDKSYNKNSSTRLPEKPKLVPTPVKTEYANKPDGTTSATPRDAASRDDISTVREGIRLYRKGENRVKKYADPKNKSWGTTIVAGLTASLFSGDKVKAGTAITNKNYKNGSMDSLWGSREAVARDSSAVVNRAGDLYNRFSKKNKVIAEDLGGVASGLGLVTDAKGKKTTPIEAAKSGAWANRISEVWNGTDPNAPVKPNKGTVNPNLASR